MDNDRRNFLALASATVASYIMPAATSELYAKTTRIRAIAFDALAIFDTRPVFALADQLFRDHGAELSNQWRTRQFEYTWLRIAAQRYVDFWQVTSDALTYAANKVKVDISTQQHNELMGTYLRLQPWPDVTAALSQLKSDQYRLAFLSNFTRQMLDGCIQTSRLDGVFERALSSDKVRTFKPDPRAYQLAMDTMKLQKEEILFVGFAGWDAASAKAFGYPTFWLNRLNLPPEELGANADASGTSFPELLHYLKTKR